MKTLFTLGLGLMLSASPAYAQFGRLNDLANKASKVKRVADAIAWLRNSAWTRTSL